MSDEKKILIIDAYNAVWRLMKRLPPLTVDGRQVQVVYGFVRLLRGAIAQFEPNIVIVCWDTGYSEFRLKTFPEYKANRHRETKEKTMEAAVCYSQMKESKVILEHLNVVQVSQPSTEADDLIGLIACNIKGRKTIVSADQDMLQLVGPDTSVWSPIKSILYTEKNFKKHTDGLSPSQFLHMRALTGDHGDNIPGVAKGFGEHTAVEVLKKYGDIETLFTTSVEKKLINRGNRYALLYSDGARDIAYRNLLIMDLTICGNHIKAKDELISTLKKRISNGTKIDKSAVKNMFLERNFVSLLRDFATWMSPFEDLDWSKE